MMKPSLVLLRSTCAAAAVLALAACGGGDRNAADTAAMGMGASGAAAGTVAPAPGDSAGAMAPGTGAATTASLSDASTTSQLDSVATAARSGLTSLAPAVAVPLIRSLEDKLDNSNDPALTDIAKDLEKLREELDDASGNVNGGDVAEILARLGPKVTNVASKAGPAQSTVSAIGSELTKAATQLRGKRQ
jgi:hypothetical protein